MENFLVIWLDEMDLQRIHAIVENVDGTVSAEGAVRWALKHSAMQWMAAKPQAPEVEIVDEKLSSPSTPVPHNFDLNVPAIPLGKHNLAIHTIPLTRLSQLGHKVIIASDTLERLIPDAGSRIKFLDEDF